MERSASSQPISVIRLVLVIVFGRIIIDTAFRALYPFLPFIAADLGVSLESAARIIQGRNFVGLAAPLFGPLSDRYGRRVLMLMGLGIVVVASLFVGVFTPFWSVILAMMTVGIGSMIFVPAAQAYLGDRVTYAQRGRAIALSETSWAAAALIGLPIIGVLVKYVGWRSGFAALGVLGIGAWAVMFFALPRGERRATHSGVHLWLQSFKQVLREPSAIAALAVTLLITMANEHLNITFGEWMKASFGLDAIALGAVASAIGVAELSSELFAGGFVDRIGKRRVVIASLVLESIAFGLLPVVARNVWFGSAGLVGIYFFFELAVVAAIPLISELAPSSRATLLSLNFASFSIGRTLGSITGPLIFLNYGFPITSIVSGVVTIGACSLFVKWVHERH